jgi:hypothetical protein
MVRENVPLKKALEPENKATIDAIVEAPQLPEPDLDIIDTAQQGEPKYIRGDIDPDVEK